jgi:hypothetical protein
MNANNTFAFMSGLGDGMDLRAYYQKIRKIEADIPEAVVMIVSRETRDGGRAGIKSEVHRAVAARMIAEGTAELAPRAQKKG